MVRLVNNTLCSTNNNNNNNKHLANIKKGFFYCGNTHNFLNMTLVYKVGKKYGWGCMWRGLAHEISGWEPQLEPAHVHLISHLFYGFREKK